MVYVESIFKVVWKDGDGELLFLNRVSSHHYLYHCQNMEPRYPSSKSREPVSEDRIILCAYLETTIGQASGFCLLANDNSQKIHVIMPV